MMSTRHSGMEHEVFVPSAMSEVVLALSMREAAGLLAAEWLPEL